MVPPFHIGDFLDARRFFIVRSGFLFSLTVCCALAAPKEDPAKRFVHTGADGRLVHIPDNLGNRVPDYSHAGYGGGALIPRVPAVARVLPGESIQAAINAVARRQPDLNGFRGAVLLAPGVHPTDGPIVVRDPGVVIRGHGKGTTILARGTGRGSVIRLLGSGSPSFGEAIGVADSHVPVGSTRLRLKSVSGLGKGDKVVVRHPSTKEWISRIGMDRFPSRDKGSYLDWKPGTMDQAWDRCIAGIEGDSILLDAPITSVLDASVSRCDVRKYEWAGRLRNSGVENLVIEAEVDGRNSRDENHAWNGVTVERADNCWVRQVSFKKLAGSAVAVWETAKRVTVQDCESVDPVSELGGCRRQSFLASGTQTLFHRCRAENGRNDFTTGHLASGPIAFVDCQAKGANGPSGPGGAWCSGVLFDRVTIDGSGLALTNWETERQGTGWSAVNCMLWQSVAPAITCRMPPTGANWAIGVWGQYTGDGHWRQFNEFVKPESLYAAQLNDRMGAGAGRVLEKVEIATAMDGVPTSGQKTAPVSTTVKAPLTLEKGRLLISGDPARGDRIGTAWWRGSTIPARAAEVGIGLTRFVPGREGPGFTDNLEELAADLKSRGVAAVEHHWGLWYDRRRDDHQMVRRADGEAWAPFYEQPWARSGVGTAWDGLSRYDLTRFNPWYFGRLRSFAEICGSRGLVLVQQMYFQHNILEAGAHWADFPWRPANCLQETGFPEPPDYAGGKRVFMAADFYDISHPVRRDLHRRYIRHCLDTLGDCPNVVFQLGEEYSGPLSFARFWLDTVGEWTAEKGRLPLVSLSCPRDVQDAILADPGRARLVGVIDLKYWWYTEDGGCFAPPGGTVLAPRQHLREFRGKKSRTSETISRAVREYRDKFPDKAVTVSMDGVRGWAQDAPPGAPTGR